MYEAKMKKLGMSILILLNCFVFSAQAFIPITVGLQSEDRKALNDAEKSFKEAAESLKLLAQQIELSKISKALTQGGVVLISTSTAVLSAYAVFLLIQYELSIQPDAHKDKKAVSWKTLLAGTIGTTVFAASILALIKSSTIADYAVMV